MKSIYSSLSFIVLASLSGVTHLASASSKHQGSPSDSIVSIDGIRLMRESDEGKALEEKLKGEVQAFEQSLQKAQSDFAVEQNNLQKQATVLSQEALQEKQAKLQRMQRDLQRQLEDKRDELNAKMQREQMSLRTKQLEAANKVREKEGWLLMIEKNAPFVLGVAQAIDKTDLILAKVNEEYKTHKLASTNSKAPETLKDSQEESTARLASAESQAPPALGDSKKEVKKS